MELLKTLLGIGILSSILTIILYFRNFWFNTNDFLFSDLGQKYSGKDEKSIFMKYEGLDIRTTTKIKNINLSTLRNGEWSPFQEQNPCLNEGKQVCIFGKDINFRENEIVSIQISYIKSFYGWEFKTLILFGKSFSSGDVYVFPRYKLWWWKIKNKLNVFRNNIPSYFSF